MNREYQSAWAQDRIREWEAWKKKGNEPRYDVEIVNKLYLNIYNDEFKIGMDEWDKEKFFEFREQIVELTFETVYFPEAIYNLEIWNIKFSSK